MRISVIGTGYLGATHAACMAELGHEVIGLDVDPLKVEALSSGVVPFHEPGLEEMIERHVSSGRLRFTTDYKEVGGWADVHFIGVGTPQSAESGAADLTYVDAAVDSLAEHISRDALVVGKSTVPVGTAARLSTRFESRRQGKTGTVRLAWNPEFLREGFAIQDTLQPDRIVVGLENDEDEAPLREVYQAAVEAGTPWITTDFATAELVKVAANAFLATKISFINAFAELMETTGGNITTLADAIGLDARIGRRFLNAGLGFGGGCLPKDIRALRARADELGHADSMAFLREVDAINGRRRDRAVHLAQQELDRTADRRQRDGRPARVAVLGAAFKPNSDDTRDSPALAVARALLHAGAEVTVYDPQAGQRAVEQTPGLELSPTLDDALNGADLMLLLTEWQEFRDLDPRRVAALMAQPVAIDGRNVLDPAVWTAGGVRLLTLGRKTDQ
ncbi:UDP-glucose/GDP-mannose dehydrogenase family protein [Micrococcus sp.]|uniref:UDP-glucose dehydrogenase family protein n=1 Tax=Micrococcus sp. TaxID=1271 RepID=UPI002A916A3D|nr:UDP-glucose/GDP-mannose dehydrogenase family protein [Micrococcus sp.]MDY6056156.1 UDP-glucose/GDP-mannose dehydrogenase family protein [Micrococcus sp.]